MGDISVYDKAVWLKYELKNYSRKKFAKKELSDKKINILCGQKGLDIPEINRIIGGAVHDNLPFWAGRMGYTEMNLIRQFVEHRMIPQIDHRETALHELCKLSGFFPCDLELGERYVDLVLEDSPGIDLQGYWHLYMEDYMHAIYQKNTMIARIAWLAPWKACDHPAAVPWSAQLKGKKVLVVHPFEQSIRNQYEKHREDIFSNRPDHHDILPEFELKTIKAVQTLAGTKDSRFKDWFEALGWMKEECRKVDFDVAVIGCGAYGFNLAAEIKRMGKTVIHLGGAKQVLLGIRATRWESTGHKEEMEKYMNSYWVRPLAEERLSNSKEVEEGCYW